MTPDPLFPSLTRTLREWDRETAALARQPYMIVRSPDRDPSYDARRRGDRTYAELDDYGSGPMIRTAGTALPLRKALLLFRTPTPEDADAIAHAEDAVRRARAALADLAREAWYRGSPMTVDELTTAANEVYGPDPVR